MKKTLFILICIFSAAAAKAQSDIIADIAPSVKVRQSDSVRSAFEEQMLLNEKSTINGFRIRIYSGIGKNSDLESAAAMASFKSAFPGIPVERSYSHSSYKVTAGYFRTKTDAARELKKIKQSFPGSFLVGESFRYPTLPSERRAMEEAVAETVASAEEQGEQ